MTPDPALAQRLAFLCRVVDKESRYLAETDQRLFSDALVPGGVLAASTDPQIAERLDAFVSRFGRLQDSLADKLLPAVLRALLEPVGAALDNLDKAEKLGFIDSADLWALMRRLRNQMVHEYIEDPVVFNSALEAAHAFVPSPLTATSSLVNQAQRVLVPGRVA
jgi:uncharacterized protein with HEPN domain